MRALGCRIPAAMARNLLSRHLLLRPSTQKGPSLEMMPVEILRQILHASYEPNLIHTCRSFYQNLPDYEAYSRSLALLAFTPRRHPWTRTRITAVDLPLPELNHSVDLDQVRLAVCRSSWLTPAILATTHLTLLEHFANRTILSPQAPLHPRDEDYIDQTLYWLWQNYRHANRKLPLIIQTQPCPGNALDSVTMEIDGFWVKISQNISRQTPPISTPPEWFCLFDMEIIPDCVLADPTDATTDTIISLIKDSEQPHQHYSCSPHLMQQAILKTIRGPETPPDPATTVDADHAFYGLISLNELCHPPAPLAAEMLTTAVQRDDFKMVRYLLLSFPRDPARRNPLVFRNQVLDIAVDDLLRLELGIQGHQDECYKELVKAITLNFDDGDITRGVAQRLGFGDVQVLKATRRAVHDLFCSVDDGEVSDGYGCHSTAHLQ